MRKTSSLFSYKRNTYTHSEDDFLFSLDTSPDFHDPLSELNIFLSNEIKQVMRHCGHPKKWSPALEQELVTKIAPRFQNKFPQYRLGISALKKTWEKFNYYALQVQEQKNAISQNGKLNIHFLIKEHIKNSCIRSHTSSLPPYHQTHQIAIKISECIAIIDGVRPDISFLSKTIWGVHRNLLTTSYYGKSPYENYDKIDQLIIKTLLDITAKEPYLSQQDIEHRIKEHLFALRTLPSFSSLDTITCNISALLAHKLYPSSLLHMRFSSEDKIAIQRFIQRQIELCKLSIPSLTYPQVVRRVIALYHLASHLPRDIDESILRLAIQSIYPNQSQDRPILPQSIYAFIAAESALMKTENLCASVEHVVSSISSAYLETKSLPLIEKSEEDLLEILIWKILDEKENFLETLPYQIGKKMEEEIGSALIDNPSRDFASIVYAASQFFKKTRELTSKNWNEIEQKIHHWSIQSDMSSKWLSIDTKSLLLTLVRKRKSQEEICQEYLKAHPLLAFYIPELMVRITTLLKYVWYTEKNTYCAFDKFILWHIMHLPKETSINSIETLCTKMLPLFPLDKDHILSLKM